MLVKGKESKLMALLERSGHMVALITQYSSGSGLAGSGGSTQHSLNMASMESSAIACLIPQQHSWPSNSQQMIRTHPCSPISMQSRDSKESPFPHLSLPPPTSPHLPFPPSHQPPPSSVVSDSINISGTFPSQGRVHSSTKWAASYGGWCPWNGGSHMHSSLYQNDRKNDKKQEQRKGNDKKGTKGKGNDKRMAWRVSCMEVPCNEWGRKGKLPSPHIHTNTHTNTKSLS